MSREEYLNQLAYLLQDIPEDERKEALEFYIDYFEEAGEGQEASVIATLGSPEKVAAQIKSGLMGDDLSAGAYTEAGYCDERFREDNKVPAVGNGENQKKDQEKRQGGYDREAFRSANSHGYAQRPRRRQNGFMIALIVALCIFASPVLLAAIGVAAGVVVSVLAVILSVAVGAIALTLAALFGGVVLLAAGVAAMWASPAVGCLMMGGGLLSLAVGILMALAVIWVVGKFVPWAIRGVINFCSRLIRRGGRRA